MTNVTHILTAVLATYIFGITTCSVDEDPINYTKINFTVCGTQIPEALSRICPGNYNGLINKRSFDAYSDIYAFKMKRGARFRHLKKWQQRLLFDLINVKMFKKRGEIATTCCEAKNCSFMELQKYCRIAIDSPQLNRIAREYLSRTWRTPRPELSAVQSTTTAQEPPTTPIRYGSVGTISTLPEYPVDVDAILIRMPV